MILKSIIYFNISEDVLTLVESIANTLDLSSITPIRKMSGYVLLYV